MNKIADAKSSDVPAIGISFQHQLDDYRSVVFQGFVERDCSDGELNKVLDKLRRASDRQKAASALPTFRIMLANKQQGLAQETDTLMGLERDRGLMHSRWDADWRASGRKGEFKVLPAQKAEADRMDQALAQSRQKVTLLKKEIADLEAQIVEYDAKVGDGVAEED